MSDPHHGPGASRKHPIYDDLVQKRGDAVTAAQEAAGEVEREAAEALDWTGLHESAAMTPAEDEATVGERLSVVPA